MKINMWIIVMVLLLVGIALLYGCAVPPETLYAQSTPVVLHPNRYIDSEYGVVCYAWNGQLDCISINK